MKSTLLVCIAVAFTLIFCAHAQNGWAHHKITEETAYFVKKSPSQILRYRFSDNTWETPIPLPEIADQFDVNDSHYYLAFGRSVERRALDGSNRTLVSNFPSAVREIAVSSDKLFVIESANSQTSIFGTESLDLLSVVSNTSMPYLETTLAPQTERLYGHTYGSPVSIYLFDFSDFDNWRFDSFRTFNSSSLKRETHLFPNESKIADHAGNVFRASDLSPIGAFGVTINDLDFYESSVPIVLSGNTVISYSAALEETGRQSVSANAFHLAVRGETVYLFHEDPDLARGIRISSIPIASLNPSMAGELIDPDGLSYELEASAVASDGTIFCISPAHASLFRWNPSTQRYGESIPLPEEMINLAYSDALDRLYLYSPGGTLYRIDSPSMPDPVVVQHLTTPKVCNKMIPMETELILARNISSQDSWLYSAEGTLLRTPVYPSAWNRYDFYNKKTRILYFNGDSLYYRGDGELTNYRPGGAGDYHSISPDGSVMVTRDGLLRSGSGTANLGSIANDIFSSAWSPTNQLFTLKEPESSGPSWNQVYEPPTILQKWGSDYDLEKEVTLPGVPLALHENAGQLTVISDVDGNPFFSVFDENLVMLVPENLPPVSSISADLLSSESVMLRWTPISGATHYDIEQKEGETGDWTSVARVNFSDPSSEMTELTPGENYEFRVTAANSEGSAPASAPFQLRTAPPPAVTHFAAGAATSQVIPLSWAPSPYADEYTLEYRASDSSDWQVQGPIENNSFLLRNLLPSSSYDIRIRASNFMGPSAYTEISARTLTAPPVAPVIRLQNASNTEVALGWASSQFHPVYVVERRGNGDSTWEVIATLSETEHIDFHVVPGSTYEYRVKSRNSYGDSDYALFSSVEIPFHPAPELIFESATHRTIRLDLPVSEADSYEIQRKAPESELWTTVAEEAEEVFVDSGLASDTEYLYRARGSYSNGQSIFGPVLETRSEPLPTPEISDIDAEWNRVAFTLGADSSLSFAVERALSEDGPWTEIDCRCSPFVDGVRFEDPTIAHETTYFYRAATRDFGGNTSKWSEVARVSTPNRTVPDAPARLSLHPAEGLGFELSWADSNRENGYYLTRWTELGGWEFLSEISANATSFLDEAVEESLSYRYALFAYNETGISEVSLTGPLRSALYKCVYIQDFQLEDIPVGSEISGGVVLADPDETGNRYLWFGDAQQRSLEVTTFLPDGPAILRMRVKAAMSRSDWDDPGPDHVLPGNGSPPGFPDRPTPAVGSFDPIEVRLADEDHGGTPHNSLVGSEMPFYTDRNHDGLLPFEHDSLAEGWQSFDLLLEGDNSTRSFVIQQKTFSGMNLDTWAIDDICILSKVPAPPSAPTFLFAGAVSDKSVHLTWDASPRATSYLVQRQRANGAWEKIGMTDRTRYSDHPLSPATRYRYRVIATNPGGSSRASNDASATTQEGPSTDWLGFHSGILASRGLPELGNVRDFDGLSYLEKFAYGLTLGEQAPPTDLGARIGGKPRIWFDPMLRNLCIEFPRRIADDRLAYIVEGSSDLVNWNPVTEVIQQKPLNARWELVRLQDSVDSTSHPFRALRVRVRLTE